MKCYKRVHMSISEFTEIKEVLAIVERDLIRRELAPFTLIQVLDLIYKLRGVKV
jgi:hypothetical protein